MLRNHYFNCLLVLLLLCACQAEQSPPERSSPLLRFEQINRYRYPVSAEDQQAIGYRLTYYFDNGKPHRWLELDSLGQVNTDYIYQYDADWVQTGASYQESQDASFQYDSVNVYGDWVQRKKIVEDSIQELQLRELYYDESFTNQKGEYYKGIFSTGEWQENEISFTQKEDLAFFTRTKDWIHQQAFISEKKNGLFMPPEPVDGLENIYNGSISPSGKKIIYGSQGSDEIFLVKKEGEKWGSHINLTQSSGIKGIYFHWVNEQELYFQTSKNNGDLMGVRLEGSRLNIIDSLSQINTQEGTEFSPYLPPDKKSLFFTAYIEDDTNSQGIFLSINQSSAQSPSWSIPTKVPGLPYAWGTYISRDGFLIYTDGDNFYRKALADLMQTP